MVDGAASEPPGTGGAVATRIAPGGGANALRMALASAAARCRAVCEDTAETVPAAGLGPVAPAAVQPVAMSAAHTAVRGSKDPEVGLMPDRRRAARNLLRRPFPSK